ncbi:MAG TPA: nuclear transport factor 2 family protein [Solirubrobacterales bacterium]|nr:nuclear transport factor 2 family protein [Solirubrobacterales bacterium]
MTAERTEGAIAGAAVDPLVFTEVARLCAAYAEHLDACEWKGLAACFTEDCRFVGGLPPSEVHGRAAATEYLRSASGEFAVVHHVVSLPVLTAEGSACRGSSAFVGYHWHSAKADSGITMGGRYHDLFSIEDGAWKIAERTIEILWSKSA